MTIPQTYILNKLYSYAMDPVFRKHDGTYNAGCPVCREGKSLGKKKRLFYYPTSNTFHCFNCSKTWSAYSWILKVSGLSKEEIQYEINNNTFSTDVGSKPLLNSPKRKKITDLPYDSINLFDETQQKYYLSNSYFKRALTYIKERRLDQAINKSPNLFISLTDFTHKNRICIPFYDRNKKICFYQTRAIDNTEPRYLGKENADKTIFGIDRIDSSLNYIFIFEGPIDAMFVKNAVSTAGLSLTQTQKLQLNEFPFYEKIWVLDNPKFDETAKEKTKELLLKGEKVFKWPSGMSYKDFNAMAMFEDLNEIPYQRIIDNVLKF